MFFIWIFLVTFLRLGRGNYNKASDILKPSKFQDILWNLIRYLTFDCPDREMNDFYYEDRYVVLLQIRGFR